MAGLYSSARICWCTRRAGVIPGSRKAAAGLAGLVKTLTLVGTLRLPFSGQSTQVRGQITLLATAVLNIFPEIKHLK